MKVVNITIKMFFHTRRIHYLFVSKQYIITSEIGIINSPVHVNISKWTVGCRGRSVKGCFHSHGRSHLSLCLSKTPDTYGSCHYSYLCTSNRQPFHSFYLLYDDVCGGSRTELKPENATFSELVGPSRRTVEH